MPEILPPLGCPLVWRNAQPEDIGILARSQRETFEISRGYPPAAEDSEAMASRVVDALCMPDKHRIEMAGCPARGGTAPVGYFWLDLKEPAPMLMDLYVDPSQRGRGRGTEIMTRVRVAARAAGATYFTLVVAARNRAAIALYDRFCPVRLEEADGNHVLSIPVLPG